MKKIIEWLVEAFVALVLFFGVLAVPVGAQNCGSARFTCTPTVTPTYTRTPGPTATFTKTNTPSFTFTPTFTRTFTNTPTPSFTPTTTPTPAGTQAPVLQVPGDTTDNYVSPFMWWNQTDGLLHARPTPGSGQNFGLSTDTNAEMYLVSTNGKAILASVGDITILQSNVGIDLGNGGSIPISIHVGGPAGERFATTGDLILNQASVSYANNITAVSYWAGATPTPGFTGPVTFLASIIETPVVANYVGGILVKSTPMP